MKSKIKIIKKKNLTIKKTIQISEKDLKRIRTREMSSTVSDWVNDLQKRRQEEKHQAFERLFSPNQQAV